MRISKRCPRCKRPVRVLQIYSRYPEGKMMHAICGWYHCTVCELVFRERLYDIVIPQVEVIPCAPEKSEKQEADDLRWMDVNEGKVI